MRTFIRGAAVEKAESYTLFEIVDGEYKLRDTADEINFEISKLEGLEAGEHKFVVQAHSNDINYESSEYSEPVSYSVSADSGTETPDDGGEDIDVFTITYKYVDSTGATIQADTTESVVAGTVKTFSPPAISGYTINSISPTSATVNENITVTYTYIANEGQEEVNVKVEMNEGLATIDEDSDLSVGDNNVQINQEYTLKATLNQPGDYKFNSVIVKDTEGNELPSDETISDSSLELKHTPDRDCSI